MTLENVFYISNQASERIGTFLASPERRATTQNINNYWSNRRVRMELGLGADSILIKHQTNLDLRITENQRHWMAVTPAIPTRLMSVLQRASNFVADYVNKFASLQKRREDLAPSINLLKNDRSSFLPYGMWSGCPDPLMVAPISKVLYAWPRKTILLARAADIIQHFLTPSHSNCKVLEIGSGSAILAGLMMHELGSRHVLVDLPEQAIMGFALLSEFFPDKRIILPHELSDTGKLFDDVDVAFITPEQLNLLEQEKFDVAININSFQEMSSASISEYFGVIRRHLKPEGIFFCRNRVSKQNPDDGTVAEFSQYPWLPSDKFLHDEILHGKIAGIITYSINSRVRESIVKFA